MMNLRNCKPNGLDYKRFVLRTAGKMRANIAAFANVLPHMQRAVDGNPEVHLV